MENFSQGTHFLYPSTIFISKEPFYVTTILGSCVAVCIWDSFLNIGAINHYMLPLWNGQGLASPKYGNIAIKKTIEKMQNLGSKVENMKAKMFGGGEILDSKTAQFNIGNRNIEIAMLMLDDYKIPIISSSTGGNRGRKILFNTQTGEVKQKFIKSTLLQEVNTNLSSTLN